MNNSRNFPDSDRGSRNDKWNRNKDNRNRFKKEFGSGQEYYNNNNNNNDWSNNDYRQKYKKNNDNFVRQERPVFVKEQPKPVNQFNVREEYGKLMSPHFKWIDYCILEN